MDNNNTYVSYSTLIQFCPPGAGAGDGCGRPVTLNHDDPTGAFFYFFQVTGQIVR